MLEFLFNRVAGFPACNFIKKILEHRYFEYYEIFKNAILKNICERLFLKLYEYAHQQAEKSILQLKNYVHQQAAGLSWLFCFSVSSL